MKADNIVQIKSYNFALDIIKLSVELKSFSQFELASQVIRSGTSIGANIEEALGAQSRKDFYSKLTISYKEARETHYWLRLLRDSKIGDHKFLEELINKCDELLKIIGSIQKSLREKGV